MLDQSSIFAIMTLYFDQEMSWADILCCFAKIQPCQIASSCQS